MSQQTQTERIALVCGPDDARRTAVQNHLTGRGIDKGEWFAPGALHDLDRAVRQGRIHHVIFAGLPDLLEGIWEEEIVFEEWPADTRIEFVHSSDAIDAPRIESLRELAASWSIWRQRHRRRQAWAGLVLSIIVLALSFALCGLLATRTEW